MKRFVFGRLFVALTLAGCGQAGAPTAIPADFSALRAARPMTQHLASKFAHVVIIVQENRSVDDLFNGLPGADTVRYGKDSKGQRVALAPVSLTAKYDISHRHDAFEVEYDGGRLDGFNLVQVTHCKKGYKCPRRARRSYGYVPHSEVAPYFTMAEEYGFGDRMFQSNQGPSFPAHQYLLSGTSTIEQNATLRAAENPRTPQKKLTGGCDSPPGSLVELIDIYGDEDQEIYPCFDRIALTNLLDDKSLSWRYYGLHRYAGLWNAPDAILQIRRSPYYAEDDVAPPSTILRDIARGYLANVSWVTPTELASDHAGHTDGSGPSWVASVVNAVGKSRFWRTTAIFVVWDDWGGWYDHVPPRLFNSYELGFRVPLIAISPYSKAGYVSHRRHEFGSILRFVEKTFGLRLLGTTDARSDDLSDFFDFRKPARHFVPIRARLGPNYFLKQGDSSQSPDDDF